MSSSLNFNVLFPVSQSFGISFMEKALIFTIEIESWLTKCDLKKLILKTINRSFSSNFQWSLFAIDF